MSDEFESAFNRLREKAKEKANNAHQSKIDTWNRVKSEMPEIAAVLTEINGVFGKPKAVLIQKQNSEVVLKSGDFDQPKNFFIAKSQKSGWQHK